MRSKDKASLLDGLLCMHAYFHPCVKVQKNVQMVIVIRPSYTQLLLINACVCTSKNHVVSDYVLQVSTAHDTYFVFTAV
jgi:hypothetical protein